MKTHHRIKALGLFAALVLSAQSSLGASIFVRNAKGTDLSRQQVLEVTTLVRNAVTNMSEHTLVNNENQADFILQPSIVNRGDQMALRIEKQLDGEVIAMAEEPISSVNASNSRALSVTETAVNDDFFVTADSAPNDRSMTAASDESASTRNKSATDTSRGDTSSATSMSASDMGTDNESGTTSSTSASSAGDSPSVGEVTAPSPRFARSDRVGTFMIGVGPSFAINLENDQAMYNINAAYGSEFSERVLAKVFGDFNLSSGGDSAQFINLGIAAEVYPLSEVIRIANGRPYVSGDVGYAFTRNNLDQTKDAPAIGVGAGFKFMASDVNMDVNLHYTLLTAQISEDNPQILSLRFAVNF